MLLVGLTGGIASGKTSAAARLAGHGAHVIDADGIAREVVEPGEPAFDDIVERFGRGVVAADGTLDRAALGRVVFADDEERAALEAITHPRIAARTAERIAQAGAAGERIVVLDLPLLVEADIHRDYDAIVVVATRPATQIDRLTAQRGLSRAEAEARVAAQAPLDAKLAVATHVVWNEGSPQDLESRVDEVWQDLVRRADAAA